MKKLLSIILTVVMLCSIFALPAAAETETDNRVWFDLNGNSRLFVKSGDEPHNNRTTYTDYLPGVDFAGYLAAPTGDFATLMPLADVADSEIRTTLKVLSIGNSYSDDAHTYLTEIAQNAGFEEIIIGNAYRGGCTLNQHHSYITSNTPAYIYKLKKLNENGSISKTESGTEANTTLLECIKAEDWDIITIQQGSAEFGKDNTYGNLQNIINYVNDHKTNKNAKIVWHQTWAYADNSTVLEERYNGISQIEMYNRIVSAMQTNVLPLNDIAFVIPAGTAVQNVRAKLGDVLTDSDAVHLNPMGDYIAGLTWFAKITGMSIDNITYAPAAVGDNLETIKTAVKNAIANPYQVTE